MLAKLLFQKKELRILMVSGGSALALCLHRKLTAATRSFWQLGLDAAGKTSILYKLKLGENVQTIPTIGKAC